MTKYTNKRGKGQRKAASCTAFLKMQRLCRTVNGTSRKQGNSVFKMAHARHHHCHVMLLAKGDGIFIPDGASGLDDGGDAGFMRYPDAIVKREKGISGHYRPM